MNIPLKQILICAMLASGEPLTLERLNGLFPEDKQPEPQEIKQALNSLEEDLTPLGLTLKETASGYSLQITTDLYPYIVKLFEKRPPKYSRALLETLALVAYRQPITRAEVEDVRGVSVSSHIFKILMEREWIRIIGHKDVPGKPALYATTKQFLDYFNLKSLQDLPSLINFTAEHAEETQETQETQEADNLESAESLENQTENHESTDHDDLKNSNINTEETLIEEEPA